MALPAEVLAIRDRLPTESSPVTPSGMKVVLGPFVDGDVESSRDTAWFRMLSIPCRGRA